MINLRAALAATAAVTALLAVGACGGETPKSQPPVAAGSAVPTASTPAPAVPEYKSLDKKALAAALLPLSAMPAGYSEDTSDDSDDADKTFCNYKQPHIARTEVSKSYQKGGGFNTEIIGITLRQYDNPQHAKESFDKMAKTLETCRKDTLDGQRITYSLMNLPPVGDNSLGVRIEGNNFTLLQGFSLVGPTLVSTGTGGMMSANADVVADLLAKQVDQYTTKATK